MRFYVGVGSDHTDRALEAHSVALSKQICDKPVGPTLWPYEEVAPHWDQLVLRSWIHEDGARRIYQEGAVSALLAPTTLIERYVGTAGTLDDGTAMFCGTLPAKGGVRPTPTIEVVLDDPVRKRALRHAYRTELLPIVA